MAKQLGAFVVGDSDKCTGCKACELACFTVHNQKSNGVGRTVGTVSVPVMPRLFLVKGETFSVPVQCKHCEDAPCLNACTKKAISRVDNQVIIDEKKCMGCKDCMMACPFGVIMLAQVYDRGKVLRQTTGEAVKGAFKCDLCAGREAGPACVEVCPHQALRYVDPVEERKEKMRRAAETLAITKTL
ncbi:electron transport protein HydN [Sporobacter termitidis DSM 10068]|uniref:Electron transport protein HydN n=1 Tax=Sporobacter termitidis DSM 10068 TaxID=1123282 RepID=A0A1M5TYZ5_9FIRM|nr:4Fe-4S dicluster domain-containing protein [Sporobacter termitidis]SHH56012.1 electron transport protein HydN [Sporobacter termitidis DSM 10068]